MTHQVLHQPRVAWDLARTVVAAAESTEETYVVFRDHLVRRLGAVVGQELVDTRKRLARSDRDDARFVEIGRWRFRLEDLLRDRPDLAEDLQTLRKDAARGLTAL
jgi:hypothetical protein